VAFLAGEDMAKELASLEALRRRINAINHSLLDLLNERARVVQDVREVKTRYAMELFSPSREQEMLEAIVAANRGPFSNEAVRRIFKEVFRASLGLMEEEGRKELLVSRAAGKRDVVVTVRGRTIGLGPVVIAGPCSVEDEVQMETVARAMKRLGVGFLRGGAYKPRTSPYAFQGLGKRGLELLAAVGRKYDLVTVTEVVDTRTAGLVAEYADILQIGSRNMANYELLKEVGATMKPVVLKRGFGATLEEFLQAAEYIAGMGNENIILCERGVRTFARETRFTLDISAVPLLKQMARLKVIVDTSHAAGRRDIIPALSRAALAAGADGVMVEVHPNPNIARSDNQQQLDIPQFEALLEDLRPFLGAADRAAHRPDGLDARG